MQPYVFAAHLQLANMKQPKCLSHKCDNGMCIAEYSSAIKRNFATWTTWMDLEASMFSKNCQIEKDKHHRISDMWNLKTSEITWKQTRLIDIENKEVVATGGRWKDEREIKRQAWSYKNTSLENENIQHGEYSQ